MKIFSKQFPEYMLAPLEVPHLTKREKIKALIASVAIGILTFGIVHAACALFFSKKKVTSLQNNPNSNLSWTQVHRTAAQHVPSMQAAVPDEERFIQAIRDTIDHHITPVQRVVLLECFRAAAISSNPRATFELGIDQYVNHPRGWGASKAAHIKKNLSALFPQYLTSPSSITDLSVEIQTLVRRDGFIAFYKNGPTEFLGNFSKAPIKIWNQQFTCAEAAFQWGKYQMIAQAYPHSALANDLQLNDFFTADGEQAFQLNRSLASQYKGLFHRDWQDGLRDRVMWDILNVKFQQNASHAQLLAATKGAYLLEHNERKGRDAYWSDDHDGSGVNMLGQMLMAIREGATCPPVNNRIVEKTSGFCARCHSLSYNIF